MTNKQSNILGWVSAIIVIVTQLVTAVWLIATMYSAIDNIKETLKDYKTRIEKLESNSRR
jgi:uncharacterized protein YoxC